MKINLSARLGFSFLLVTLVGMALITPSVWLAVENSSIQTQTDNLKAQAHLIASALGGSGMPVSSPVPYSQLSNAQPGIHTRIIDARGGVVIDLTGVGNLVGAAAAGEVILPGLAQNAAGMVTPAELMARPEIAQARQGQSASAVRQVSQAGGQPVLYVAAPVFSPEGQVVQLVYLAAPVADTRWSALPTGVRLEFFGILLAVTMIAGSSGWWFARRIARPLDQLKTAAEKVASGDLDQHVPVDDHVPDLAVVGRSFNQMTHSLRQANQAKNGFIANVSHELRTPLTVLKGSIETLQDGAVDDLAARDDFLSSMSRETDRLIRLVNDLLLLTRADAGMLKLNLKPLDLAELAQARCQALAPLAQPLHVTLSVLPGVVPVMDLRVSADEDRMAQVLDNLLANAIRYSPVGGVVTVSVTRAAGQVTVRVSDSGPGIASQHLPFIFDRFYKVESSRDRSQGGNGLGLAIVRGLVEAQGGKVRANSIPGDGTTISFIIPACS